MGLLYHEEGKERNRNEMVSNLSTYAQKRDDVAYRFISPAIAPGQASYMSLDTAAVNELSS